ncbi:MAG: lysophospholipid acyltransferase family protein, partial [Vicinamibacterales bacterium]
KRTGHMLVDRKRPDRSRIFEWASTLTAKGLSLIMFPEGTRSPDGFLGKFKGGGFLLALQTGLPVVPISVVGSRHVMQKGQLTTKPGRVTLVVHAPIAMSEHENEQRHAAKVRAFADRVREVIRPVVESEASDAKDVEATRPPSRESASENSP